MIEQYKSEVPEKPLILPIWTRVLRDGTMVPYPTLHVLKKVMHAYTDMLDELLASDILDMPEESIEQVHLDVLKDALIKMLADASVPPSI